MLSNLKEITLHQQNIEKIELVGDVCRELEILYLQNNIIGRIENLHHLKVGICSADNNFLSLDSIPKSLSLPDYSRRHGSFITLQGL